MYMYLKRQTNDSDSNEYSRHAVHVRVSRALPGAIHDLERQLLVEQGGLTTHGGRTQLVLLGCREFRRLEDCVTAALHQRGRRKGRQLRIVLNDCAEPGQDALLDFRERVRELADQRRDGAVKDRGEAETAALSFRVLRRQPRKT